MTSPNSTRKIWWLLARNLCKLWPEKQDFVLVPYIGAELAPLPDTFFLFFYKFVNPIRPELSD